MDLSAKPTSICDEEPYYYVLWKTESESQHWWLTDVRVRNNGDMAICSGDSKYEWYAIINKDALPMLHSALKDPDSSPEILTSTLLYARFKRNPDQKNPFEEIKSFLTDSEIPWEADFW